MTSALQLDLGGGSRLRSALATVASELAPGQQAEFLIRSREHASRTDAARRTLPFRRSDDVTLRAVARAATRARLLLTASRPVGVLAADSAPAFLRPTLASHAWRRLLSWVPEDERLARLVTLIEGWAVIVAPVGATPQAAVTVEGSTLSRTELKTANLAHAKDRTTVAGPAALPAAEVDELAHLLGSPRTDYLLFTLVGLTEERHPEVALADLLPASSRLFYDRWRKARAADAAAMAAAAGLRRSLPAEARSHDGTDLLSALDYGLVPALLARHARFEERR